MTSFDLTSLKCARTFHDQPSLSWHHLQEFVSGATTQLITDLSIDGSPAVCDKVVSFCLKL